MPLLCRNARVKWDALLNPQRSAICSTVASVERSRCFACRSRYCSRYSCGVQLTYF